MSLESRTIAEPEVPDPDFEALLDYIHRGRGFDFTGYKRASLVRRVVKRMQVVGVEGYIPYVDYLEVHPEEFRALFDTILINVTGFFRDPQAWEALAEEIIPRLLAGKRPEEPIRAWSAGCASGEEAYSLAIALAEALGPAAFRDRVKIYATDVDEHALAKARSAQYDAKEVQGLPPALLAKYFEPINPDLHGFQKDLRRCLIFGRHDLIQDAPISRIDLLACRNTLMYFNTETQARILDRFHFALSDRSFLFLGKAETLMTYTETFIPIDLKRRIFAKVPRPSQLRDRLIGLGRAGAEDGRAATPLASQVKLRELAFEGGPVAQLVVESGGLLSMANEKARGMFAIDPADLGRPFQDLQVSYRPADLRTCIDRAYDERKPAKLAEVEWSPRAGEVGYLDIHVIPLFEPGGGPIGASITFVDATVSRRLQEELATSHRELESAYEELQSTNEELETMNEELQSTIEELETTNEELQSTNEELETMNEELQSTNEEIETVNEELGLRGEDRDKVNAFLQSILAGLKSGVIVVDPDLLVQLWNARSEELWGLRSDEVLNKNLLNLAIGLPLEQLRPAIRACLAGEPRPDEVTVDAVNRRGKPIRCRVTCTPIGTGKPTVGGVILLVDGEDQASLVS
jgi:two-component system, chemotaxis family, CheB/CheR fusion protein